MQGGWGVAAGDQDTLQAHFPLGRSAASTPRPRCRISGHSAFLAGARRPALCLRLRFLKVTFLGEQCPPLGNLSEAKALGSRPALSLREIRHLCRGDRCLGLSLCHQQRGNTVVRFHLCPRSSPLLHGGRCLGHKVSVTGQCCAQMNRFQSSVFHESHFRDPGTHSVLLPCRGISERLQTQGK